MLDTFVGKKIHTLKNKQTSKQKQEEDRKINRENLMQFLAKICKV